MSCTSFLRCLPCYMRDVLPGVLSPPPPEPPSVILIIDDSAVSVNGGSGLHTLVTSWVLGYKSVSPGLDVYLANVAFLK